MTKAGVKFITGHKVLGGKNNGNSATLEIEPVKGGDK